MYEHGIAMADVAMGWIYGIAGVELILGYTWAFELAWIPGVVFLYHGLSFWFWSRNQIRDGHRLMPSSMRVAWFLANSVTGVLAIVVAWR